MTPIKRDSDWDDDYRSYHADADWGYDPLRCTHCGGVYRTPSPEAVG